MKFLRNDKGFSYIEVLIVASLLSIFLTPLIMVFFNLSKITSFSREHYNGILRARSIMLDLSEAVRNDNFDNDFVSYVEQAYDMEKFEFMTRVVEISNDGFGNETSYGTFRGGVSQIQLTEEQINALKPVKSQILPHDYKVIEISNDVQNVVLNEENSVVLILDGYIGREIDIINNGSGTVFVKIYMKDGVGKEDISIRHSNGNMLIEYVREPYTKRNYILTVAIFSRDGTEVLTVHRVLNYEVH